MGIKIYISGNSGNKEIETRQQRIMMILKSLAIEFLVADISAPGMDQERDFMRAHGKKQEGQRNVLPPQIFNGEKYCGDYDDFDVANEDDLLEEFLGLPRKNPKVEPVATGAVAPEVGQLPVGKLEAGEPAPAPAAKLKPAPPPQQQREDHEETNDDHEHLNNTDDNNDHDNEPCDDTATATEEPACDDEDAAHNNDNDHEETTSDLPEISCAREEECDPVDLEVNGEIVANGLPPVMSSQLEGKLDNGEDNNCEARAEVASRPAVLSLVIPPPLPSPPELMSDGEVMRECRPGFQDLKNCKRFWQAQQLIGTP